MNKLIPLIAFSVLLLVPAGAQSAFAQEILPLAFGDCTSNDTGGGPWSDKNTWDCVGGVDVPAKRRQVQILSGDTVTVNSDLNRASGVATTFIGNVFVDGTLVVPSPFTFKADQLQIVSGSVENFGNMIIAEFFNFNIFNNNCGSTLTIQQLSTTAGGDRGPEGQNAGSSLTNFGTFELGILFPINGFFNNLSSFLNGGTLINVIVSGQDQNFEGMPITTISNICIVGGELLPIDSTALLLAGAQTNAVWIMSALVVIGSVAFGALYITSKKN